MIRFIKSQWRYQSKKNVLQTKMEQILQERNIPVYDALEEVKENMFPRKMEIPPIVEDYRYTPPALDDTHPDWKNEPCLTYKDRNVLVDGLNQAKIFTNTFEVRGGLPSNIENLYDKIKIDHQDDIVQSMLVTSLAYDMTQLKLPKVKDPARPWWIPTRVYGIPDKRRNTSVCNKLLSLCEIIAGHETANRRIILTDSLFQVPLQRDQKFLVTLTADLLLLADESLQPCLAPLQHSLLPPMDMSPMNYTASLEEHNIYRMQDLYPIGNNTEFVHPHTLIVHFNESEVRNLYDTPVVESQILGRSLMKSFAVAAAKARSQYGNDVKKLPSPITVQCVQTDARYFHFGVFQLNTLEWPPVDGEHNIFWSDEMIPIYDVCGYEQAKPILTSYNPIVFKKLMAFYINGSELQ